MASGNRIILPEHIRSAENEPDPLTVLNDDQEGPLAGWIQNRLIECGGYFAPDESTDAVAAVKGEIALAYVAIRYAYGGELPKVERATIGDYFKELMQSPDDDRWKAEADPAKLEVVKAEFSAEQVHLNEHITSQLGDGMVHECGFTYITLTHRMLMAQIARPKEPQNGA